MTLVASDFMRFIGNVFIPRLDCHGFAVDEYNRLRPSPIACGVLEWKIDNKKLHCTGRAFESKLRKLYT